MESIDIQRNALRRRDDGTIALPESVNLPAKSEEAQLASVRNLPEEMEDVVAAMLKARRTSYSIIQLLGLLLFMAGALLLTYVLLPHPMQVEELEMAVQGSKLPLPPSSMTTIANRSQALFKEKRFAQCAWELLQDRKSLDEPFLANIFCEAVYEIPLNIFGIPEYRKAALDAAAKMRERYPDDVRWPVHRVKIESKELLKEGDFHLKAEDQPRLARIEALMPFIYEARALDDRFKAKNRNLLDLLEAKMLTASWLLKGFAKGYPDDFGDIGVHEREKAYEIAMRHTEKPFQQFLELRKEIIEKILEGDSKANRYYFKGQSHYRKNDLILEREEIQKELRSMKK